MYRVLLVDDEILVRDAIKARIDWNSLGYELAGDCQNGKEAIEFVQNHPVDVVLTDICMPYVDGMELSHFLHDNYPEILIIIFSGFILTGISVKKPYSFFSFPHGDDE